VKVELKVAKQSRIRTMFSSDSSRVKKFVLDVYKTRTARYRTLVAPVWSGYIVLISHPLFPLYSRQYLAFTFLRKVKWTWMMLGGFLAVLNQKYACIAFTRGLCYENKVLTQKVPGKEDHPSVPPRGSCQSSMQVSSHALKSKIAAHLFMISPTRAMYQKLAKFTTNPRIYQSTV
jgi:hypothetical protein